uniref:Uncharacterized protein n=1 Tax=Ixodes ricinus TaxID=34613 RepID=A0A0K8RDQ0_IXORI
MDGPRSVRHDFSSTFCEVNLSMTVHNSLEDIVSVRIKTLDSMSAVDSLTSAGPVPGNEAGWHDTSRLNEIKVTTDVMGARLGRASSAESISPFLWTGLSSTKI